jgi:four helix bundle suffix protein
MQTLIPKNGGYRRLKSFQVAQLVYDLTARFCERFIPKYSRTNDQMVQAARSGVQNIAEGSKASATSKKTELKLTNVARASLEELLNDYEDFLRQRKLLRWDWNDTRRHELISKKFTTADEVARWIGAVTKRDKEPLEQVAANAIIILTKVASILLNKQLNALSEAFKNEGGFTERLYHYRKNAKEDKG